MTDPQEFRRSKRNSVFRAATIAVPGIAAPLTGRVRDVSDTGARIEQVDGLKVGMTVTVAIGSEPAVVAQVAWVADGKCGVVFDRRAPPPYPERAPLPERRVVGAESGPSAGWMADLRDGYRR